MHVCFELLSPHEFEINICHLILSKQFMHGRGEWLQKIKVNRMGKKKRYAMTGTLLRQNYC